MLCLLTAGALWLAPGAQAVALSPSADLELTRGAGLESAWPATKDRSEPKPQPQAPRMTPELARELNAAAQAFEAGEPAAVAPPDSGEAQASAQAQHSHSVLKELIAAAPARQLVAQDALEADIVAMERAAPVPPPAEEPAEAAEHLWDRQASPQPMSGWGQSSPGGDFCAGKPIYDGPTAGWDDCRKRCTGPCKFWSYWHDSTLHRCKLTAECGQREHDARHDVDVHGRVQDSTAEGVDHEAEWGEGQASPKPGSQGVVGQSCSPRGSARKFDGSPQSGGWHNLGKTHSYLDCASTAASMEYQNVVWNVGSTATGRCYGFSSDVPGVLQSSCEDTYCWLFGAACTSAGQGGVKAKN